MQKHTKIVISLLAPICLGGTLVNSVSADVQPTTQVYTVVSTNKDKTTTPVDGKKVITTEDDISYQQLQATSTNLTQQINDLTSSKSSSTDINQARIAGIKVHLANVKSQIQIVINKQEEARQKAEDEARQKAEDEAKVKAEQEAADAAQKAEQEKQKLQDEQIASAKALNTSISTTQLSTTTDVRKQLVAKAKEYLGMAYVWGGASPTSGFDCSGLTSYVYRSVLGIETGRTTWDQDAKGKHIGLNELQPGDLILQNSAEHITMYIGDGLQIDAPQPGDVIRISKVPSNPWSMYGLRFVD